MDTGGGGGGDSTTDGTDSTDDGSSSSGPQQITVEPRNVYVSEGDRSAVRDDATDYEFEVSVRTDTSVSGTINPRVVIDADGTILDERTVAHTGTASVATMWLSGEQLWSLLGGTGTYDLFVAVRPGGENGYEWGGSRVEGDDDLTLVEDTESPFYSHLVRVADCDGPTRATPGETVTVTAAVENDNVVRSIFDLDVLLDGEEVGMTTREVAAESTREVAVDVTVPDTPGTRDLSVELEAWRRR